MKLMHKAMYYKFAGLYRMKPKLFLFLNMENVDTYPCCHLNHSTDRLVSLLVSTNVNHCQINKMS